ncbi:MAG: hypothetical protein ACE5PT_04275 [Gemmatimonadales bacterium]
MRTAMLAATLGVVSSGLVAQEQYERPAQWKIRFDRPGIADSAVYFVSMPPGLHITTRRQRAIFYDPSMTATGAYRLRAEIRLFDPGRRRREAYGVFFGGADLQGDGQTYSYFLIRDTGDYLIKRRMGSETPTVVGWTPSDAIVTYAGEGTADNVLEVQCGAETVNFYINGEKVHSLPRSELDTDGVVGLRVNHGLNVHVSGLEVRGAR